MKFGVNYATSLANVGFDARRMVITDNNGNTYEANIENESVEQVQIGIARKCTATFNFNSSVQIKSISVYNQNNELVFSYPYSENIEAGEYKITAYVIFATKDYSCSATSS